MITIVSRENLFDRQAAWRVVAQIVAKPTSVVGLSTGRTTANMHRLIAHIHQEYGFDASQATFFGLDEVTGVDRSYSGACYTMLRRELLDDMAIEESQFLMLPTHADDFSQACCAFTSEIERRGGIDLLVLGLGENGHLGFNQPGSPFESTAWHTVMDPELEQRIQRETATPANKPLGGVTLGLRDIMHARPLLLVAKGKRKASIVREMLLGSVTPQVPASILQLHPSIEFLFDAEAASLLPPSFHIS